MNDPHDDESGRPTGFRRNLIRVLTVQVVTLVLLWLLQERFGR
ncbi:MAG: hypothetical protein AB7L66_07605 [Gemmatimonadales bacterium]